MKIIIQLLIACLLSTGMLAQGIDFIHEDFASAIKKAKKESKPLMFYAYASWCGPCKAMKKSIFPKKEVGDIYNKAFVNVMVDMEKGQGPELSKKYKIKGYPTFFFLDTKGEILHQAIGGRSLEQFMELGEAAQDPDRQVSTLRRRYKSGDRSPKFLKKLTMAVSDAEYAGFEPFSIEYLDTQDDWTTEENMKFLFDYSEASIKSPLFQYTMKNKDAFVKLLGEQKVNQKIAFAADQDLRNSKIDPNDESAVVKHYEQYFSKEKAKTTAKQMIIKNLMYSEDAADHEKFKTEAQLFLATKPDVSSNFLNSVAWTAYELFEDKDMLQKAAEWAQWSIDKDANSYNTDTKAWILHKLGDDKEAKKYAEQSIQLAKESGQDYSSTQELLNTIDAKR